MRKIGGSSDVGTSVAFGRANSCRRETNIDVGGEQILWRKGKEGEKGGKGGKGEERFLATRTALGMTGRRAQGRGEGSGEKERKREREKERKREREKERESGC
jgi:hypothetical protein